MVSMKKKTTEQEKLQYFKYLPKKYWFSHQFCFFLHDQLVQIIASGERDRIFNVTIQFKDKEEFEKFQKATKKLSGEKFWNWLENNGYEEIAYSLTYRQICAALISDLCHFVYEALDCSKKEKLTVTYALLRKPFKENLFYLEWLLTDPEDLLRKFHFNGIESLIVSGVGAISPQKKKEIIKKAMKKTSHGEWIDSNFIYNLRYDKKAVYGLEQLWQRANHLITSYKFLETEEKNFNFVFSSSKDHISQWDHLYSFLPLLLYHALEIAQALIGTFTTIENEEEQNIIELRTTIGLLFWMEKRPRSIKVDALLKIAESFENARLSCPRCKKPLPFKKEDLILFCEKGVIKCRRCRYKIELDVIFGND